MGNLIIAEHVGFNTPTIVSYKNERLETVGLNIETLVKTWRSRWFNLKQEWIVLALPDKEYKAIQQKPLSSIKSLIELFYEQKVICINSKPIEDKALKEWSIKCEAEHEKFMNELEMKI